MPPEPLVDEEDYASSEDSDFAPDDAPDHASFADSDDDDGEKQTATTAATASKRKRDEAGDDGAEDAGFENSGDEAIIGKGMKKQQHKRRRRDSHDDEDGGGAGGFIKTRRQRANEKAERRAAAVRGPVTVDVDALWAQMTATADPQKQQQAGLAEVAAAAAAAVAAAAAGGGGREALAQDGVNDGDGTATPKESSDDDGSGLIKIKRTYNFAGKVHTEEKMVARNSAEAKLYRAEQAAKEKDAKKETDEDAEDAPPERPPPRKAFRSIFEPLPPPAVLAAGVGAAGLSRRADLDLGLRARLLARERGAQERQQAAKKLNTVEKSRMDWAGFVDKEGIQDELALAGKAKGSFAERQLFLARSEARREEEARRARLSGKV